MASGCLSDRFRNAMSAFPSGVTVVTTRDRDGSPQGLTVSAFMSVSLDPILVAVGIARSAGCYESMATNDTFAVNVLAGSAQELSNRFAAKGLDRFAGVDWRSGVSGAPLLTSDVVAYLDCTVQERVVAGDHDIIVGRVLDAWSNPDGAPLIYHQRRYCGVEAA
jgi:flavin reductase (DIM6/NTAB) family NADH-FMN oxidoreductase RutF